MIAKFGAGASSNFSNDIVSFLYNQDKNSFLTLVVSQAFTRSNYTPKLGKVTK